MGENENTGKIKPSEENLEDFPPLEPLEQAPLAEQIVSQNETNEPLVNDFPDLNFEEPNPNSESLSTQSSPTDEISFENEPAPNIEPPHHSTANDLDFLEKDLNALEELGFAEETFPNIQVSSPSSASVSDPETPPRDFAKLKEYAESIPIGNPDLEANPPFSLYASGAFTENDRIQILSIINDLKLGIHNRDIELQLDMGKLFIPQISEYVAIFIAQKIMDYVDNIEINPTK